MLQTPMFGVWEKISKVSLIHRTMDLFLRRAGESKTQPTIRLSPDGKGSQHVWYFSKDPKGTSIDDLSAF